MGRGGQQERRGVRRSLDGKQADRPAARQPCGCGGKENTVNDLSLDDFAISTANLWARSQRGESLCAVTLPAGAGNARICRKESCLRESLTQSVQATRTTISAMQNAMPNPIHFQASELIRRYPLVPRDQATNAKIGQPNIGRIKKATRAGQDNGWFTSSAARLRVVLTQSTIVDEFGGLGFLAASSLRAARTACGK